MLLSSEFRSAFRLPAILAFCACLIGVAQAQSSDIALPTAIQANEITGSIGARDIGDPRLTDHYYAFTGTPGDVLITIESRNLNGDIDVFTSTGLRPLLKITVYSNNSAPITKSIYLRKREDLILRVEARTPNDDEGTYRIHFGGSFEPITSGPLVEAQPSVVDEAPTLARGKKGRRVSSVGARIDEPPATDVAVVPTPEPTPGEAVTKPAEATTKTAESTETAKAEPAKAPAKPPRGRRGAPRRTRTPAPPKAEETVTKSETNSPTIEEAPTDNAPTTAAARRNNRRSASARRREEAAAAETAATPAESGPRLIIETTDGTLINRYMSSVRRVTIENNQVVVVGKDGKIERIRLASLLRMTVAP
jgi:hypothetical protein